ncbi:MAG: tryptophan halogenase family protein [Sphingopyxis sp.]|uniref:tryptophan halogenase family protein n=1 Tax=Sphingopyxis sp. TaxID=1908224 RepID=UPI002ABA0522|nr:tryptophan halogenase family protein [Sphingopyxis sp.]MDZ3832969.1 tryptophan halogenase family protein [Sphingopyxis sp.]
MGRRFDLVIVGGGTAGWMCAAACAAKLDRSRFRIRLIESEEIGTVGVGEATLPQMKDFNDFLGLDEVEFMQATQASFKLGIEFVNWGREGDRYIHPFGTFGRPIGEADFFSYWVRAHHNGTAAPLSDYCFPIVAARQNHFMLPTGKADDVRNAFAYAYHLDAFLYARYLRRWAEERGIERVEGRIVDVERDTESGRVAAVTLQSDARIEGDMFVDCSGFRSLLLGQALGVELEEWTHWLPCDRAVAVPSVRSTDFTPYTRSTRRKAGWQWRIPLQHRTGNGYVYASQYISDDEAAAALLSSLDGEALAEPRVLRFTAGKRRYAWAQNVVGMGLAGGFLEPLESTSIYLVQMAIMHMLTLLPSGRTIDPALPNEFNRVMDVEYDRIRDFLILHYVANDPAAPLWQQVTAMDIPQSLTAKIERFRNRAYVEAYRDGLFGPPSWQAVFVGQGIMPAAADRLADAMPDAVLADRLGKLAQTIERGAATAPLHADFVARYCPAPLP